MDDCAWVVQMGATPDFPMLLQKVLMTDPAGAVNLALQIGQMTPPPMDFNYIADLFLQVQRLFKPPAPRAEP
jgi:clathrin heavy chain